MNGLVLMSEGITIKDVTESLVKVYGPFAFGIVSLLTIWFAIISPELNRKQLDFEAYSKLIEKHQQENLHQDDIAKTMRDTVLILDRVTQRLERIDNGNP